MERLLGTLGYVPEGSGRSEGAVLDRVREGFIKQLGLERLEKVQLGPRVQSSEPLRAGLPERRTPSTTEESGASDADDIDEGSDDEFDSLNFAEVPEDGLPAAPPVAGSVCATPSRQYIGTVTAT
ncbi:unnamed protein product [Effrenium voratum]|uniref:Uncharacterized protein n=1 Tax=Effrenium voratum TaxID=2562239 RepID=A0AA36IAJ5_9DINO|nr:unnamed protein product [Effrenium voratum]